METILIVIHLMIVIALVVVVLLQRSEGGALGIGGGGGGMMSARGAANALTKVTGILAAGFFITSLSLGILARYGSQPTDILDQLPSNQGQQSDGGSLLDQLGGLPAEEGGADGAAGNQSAPAEEGTQSLIPSANDGPDGTDETGNAPSGDSGAADTDTQSLIPSANDGPGGEAETQTPTSATGAQDSLLLDQSSGEDAAPANAGDTGQIPANPGETAPNAADSTFIPPVEDSSAVEQAPANPVTGDSNQ